MHNLLIAVIVLVAFSCCSATDLTPATLYKNYANLNKYLEKKVTSDDPLDNLREAIYLQHEKPSRFSFFGSSNKALIDTTILLEGFSSLYLPNYICNQERIEKMNLVDAGLADKSRSKMPNYPLTRVDKIIQHFALKDARYCGYTDKFPKLEYGYKQIAYDNINGLLEKGLPSVEDVSANMAKAEELLNGMADGALADALRQLLRLKSLSSKSTCGERGFDILLKNDLAAREHERDKQTRRINKIVQHFAAEHQQICRSGAPNLVKSALKKLDIDSFRRVLGLVAARFMDHEKMRDLVLELNKKQNDEEFSTPYLEEHVTEMIQADAKIAPETIYYYVIAVSDGNPLSKSIHGTVDTNTGMRRLAFNSRKKVFELDQVEKLLGEYLIIPCDRFQQVVGKSIQAGSYGTKPSNDEFMKEISYHTARAASSVCKYLIDNQQEVLQAVMDESDKH